MTRLSLLVRTEERLPQNLCTSDYFPDHPIYSAVLACDVGAVILLSLAVSDPNRNSYSPKPVFLTVTDDLRSLVGLLRPSPVGHINWIRIARLPGQKVLAMYACILCVRVELFRQITVHSQCASTGYTVKPDQKRLESNSRLT